VDSGAGNSSFHDAPAPDDVGPQEDEDEDVPEDFATTGKTLSQKKETSANGHLPVLAKMADVLQNKALDEGLPLQANNDSDDDSDAQTAPDAEQKKRIEVTNGGMFWQWRWSEDKKRKSEYGGKFTNLPEARQRAYRRNKQARARIQRARHKEN